jgi:hypothetical protein
MTAQTILPANSVVDTGYDVDNSLRFNDGSSDCLTDTMGTATNRKIFTHSFWIKRGILSSGSHHILESHADANNRFVIFIHPGDDIRFLDIDGGSTVLDIRTNAKLRDPSAWYHIVCAVDTTQSTASNRTKIYINGVLQDSFSTNTVYSEDDTPDQGTSSHVHNIGRYGGDSGYFDGYMSEVVFIDGSQLTAASFGEFDEDSGIWKPISVSDLTFGNNGFYLEFKQSGTGTNASGMGADTSGNDHHFAVSNLTAVDQTTDTCTNNFATINPLVRNSDYNDGTLAEGNTYFAPDGRAISVSSIGVTSGKWYAEFKTQDAGALYVGVGLLRGLDALSDGGMSNPIFYDNDPSYAIGYGADGALQYNSTTASYGSGYSDNNIVGIALDMDNKEFYISVNGTFQASGDPTSGASKTNGAAGAASYNPLDDGGEIFFFVSDFSAGGVGQCFHNYGNPAFAISSGNADGNGFGNFEYAVPSGYFALNTKNLASTG